MLCVDDDPASLRLLLASLARAGRLIECVCDGAHALEQFADDPCRYDVLVTDHIMPGMDGLALVGQLRELGFEGEVIVTSAQITSEEAMRYYEWGCRLVLNKPLDVARLRSTVETALAENAVAVVR